MKPVSYSHIPTAKESKHLAFSASIVEVGLCPPSRLIRWDFLQISEDVSDTRQSKSMRNDPFLWVLLEGMRVTSSMRPIFIPEWARAVSANWVLPGSSVRGVLQAGMLE